MNPTANESLHFHMENSNNPQKIDILMKRKLSGFAKDTKWKISSENVWRHLILRMCLCEFHFQTLIFDI